MLTKVSSPRKPSLLGDLAPVLEKDTGNVVVLMVDGKAVFFRFFEDGYEAIWENPNLAVKAPNGEIINCGYKDNKLFGEDIITCEHDDTGDLAWVAEVMNTEAALMRMGME